MRSWLPRSGDPTAVTDVLQHAVPPAVALGLLTAGIFLRLVRTNVIGTLGTAYVDAARSRGVSAYRLVRRHAYRPALIPIITVIGLQIAVLLGGAPTPATLRRLEWGAHSAGVPLYVGTGLLDVSPTRVSVVQGAGLDVMQVRAAPARGPRRLLKGVVVDQHFAQRSRYGRLLSVVAASPSLLGIGIDEDTAIEVHDGTRFTVHGRGGVIVMDCRGVTTDAPDARRGAPLLISGAVIHTLPAGATFDLASAELVDFVEQHPDVDAGLAAAKA